MFMQSGDGKWELDIMDGWPSSIQLNVYDYDDYFYGNTDGDGVLDRLPPNSLAVNFVNMSAPPKPHLPWTLIVDDSTMTWSLQPRGYLSVSTILYGLLFTPFLTALIAAYIFMRSHYGIKYNQFGVISKGY
jgi:alpha-1,3-glucan synthase